MPAFDTLLEGYRRFRAGGWAQQRARWNELAEGQSPETLVMACSDSRLDPATIFDASPGEIFVIRNIGNLVPPFERDESHHGTSAALEFAVTQIPVKEILVLGHEFCGACKASMARAFVDAPQGEGGFIRRWVALLDHARDHVVAAHGEGHDAERAMERAAVEVSLANLRTFPFVAEAEAAGKLRLRGGWFGIREGRLMLREDNGDFRAA